MIIRTLAVLVLFAAVHVHASDHPFRALTDKELKEVVRIIKADSRYKAGSQFTWVQLVEPSKERMLKGEKPPREVRVLLLEPKNIVMDVIVDLGDRSMM
jgi:Cu2+-containing amine oxidase